jgi:hypothetical protein
VGSDAGTPRGQVLITAVGIRDLALGLGTAWALGGRDGARPWLLASTAADLTDAAVHLRHRDAFSPVVLAGVVALAGGAGAAGAWLSAVLD